MKLRFCILFVSFFLLGFQFLHKIVNFLAD